MHRHAVNLFTHRALAFVSRENNSRRIVGQSGQDFDSDTVLFQTADDRTQTDLRRADFRSVVLRQDKPAIAILFHQESPRYTDVPASERASLMRTRSITATRPFSPCKALVNSGRFWLTTTA